MYRTRSNTAASSLRLSAIAVVLLAWGFLPVPRSAAAIIGSWDFSSGALTAASGVSGVQLSFLPDTPIYAAAGGTPNPPPLAYATTGSFGIASLGGASPVVLRIPDMRDRGPATGLMAAFPQRSNGQSAGGAPATKLNRYSLVMDVLVPGASFTGPPNYLDLFQPRGNADGALFINKLNHQFGSTVAYGGSIAANQWYRMAMVMQLDASTSAPRYETYIDGQPIGQIVWDQIVVDSTRNQELRDRDLIPDGGWSIAALSETSSLLPSNASGFFLFNDNTNELGELYVANLQFRDDALTAADIATLGGPAPGLIAVPEPTSLGLAAAAAIAAAARAGMRISRRRFAAGCAGGAALALGRGAGGQAALAQADVLAEYATARDPSTTFVALAAGEALGGRWRTGRLVSQTWRGCVWTHELSLFLPDAARDGGRAILWIDGGNEKKLPADGLQGPTDAVKVLAAVANAAGMPAAVVRQVPFQPMFDDLSEDGLIAHTFVEYARTGDASWPLLLPMVKSAVEAMNAVTVLGREHWDAAIDEFVVTGGSKRGWTTWLSAAVDRRVAGIVPMVIDMLSLEDHVKLQLASFGRMSEHLVDYTSRGIEGLLATPRGRELIGIVDPYAYRDRYTMPKVIALGTNDPYWPLEACNLYYDGLPGPRWISYAPNAGHGLPIPRVVGLVAALGRHVAGIEPLPPVEWRFDDEAGGAACVMRSEAKPDRAVLWTAASPSRDFRKARWSSEPIDAAGPEWRVPLERPAAGFFAGLVELQFDREPVPLLLTSGVKMLRAG